MSNVESSAPGDRFKWLHLDQLIRPHAAPSAATKGFVHFFHICRSAPQDLSTNFHEINPFPFSVSSQLGREVRVLGFSLGRFSSNSTPRRANLTTVPLTAQPHSPAPASDAQRADIQCSRLPLPSPTMPESVPDPVSVPCRWQLHKVVIPLSFSPTSSTASLGSRALLFLPQERSSHEPVSGAFMRNRHDRIIFYLDLRLSSSSHRYWLRTGSQEYWVWFKSNSTPNPTTWDLGAWFIPKEALLSSSCPKHFLL